MNYPIFSFFSGSGFLDLGFEHAGFNIDFVNEIDKSFMKSYKYSREMLNLDKPLYGYHERDISEFLKPNNGTLSEAIDELKSQNQDFGFIGGPPCPDFSIGGKNRGKDGDNGILSWTFVELISKERPSFFMFENVKGLIRTKKHRAFYKEMKNKVQSNGYILTEKLINSLEYGVPQHRERIILIGFSSELLKKLNYEIDPKSNVLPENIFPWNKNTKYSIKEIENIPFPNTNEFVEDSYLPIPPDIPRELTIEYWFRKNDVTNHPNSNQHFIPRAGLPRFKKIQEGDDSRKSYKRPHRWRYSPTAAYGNNEVHLHPYKARRLSVAETLAIQSMPKDFELPQDISLTSAFKTVGNGVPYLASLGIAKSLLEFLGGSLCDSQQQTLSQQSINYLKTEPTTI